MPKQKGSTYNMILDKAKAEFLSKGFGGVSLRDFAGSLGITAPALYKHFKNKEELFESVVKPALDVFETWYKKHKDFDYEIMKNGNFDTMWESDADKVFISEIVYPHFAEFKLLLCCSKGTRFENWLHDFIMLEQKETELYMKVMKEEGYECNEIDQEELHILMSSYVTALLGCVIHDFPLEKALHYMDTFKKFFNPAWRNILGF